MKRGISLTWQRLRTVPGLGRDVAALTMLVLVGTVAATIILSQMRYVPPWSDKFTFAMEFDEAVAVSAGNGQEVRVAGVEVGVITDLEATSRNTSRVTVALERNVTVYDNARAVLRPVNPLNQMYVSLDPGGPPGKPLAMHDVLPVAQTSRPIQPEEVFNHLDERSRRAVANLLAESDNALANASDTLPDGLASLKRSLVGARPVLEALAQRRESIRELVGSLSRIATAIGDNDDRLTRLVDSTQHTLAVLARNDGALRRTLERLPGVSQELRGAMTSTTTLTAELNPVLRKLHANSKNLPAALERLGETVVEAKGTIESARPIVAKARPVVDDLRPVVGDLDGTFGELKPVTRWADYATAQITPWMYDLSAFVYNTSSIFSVRDRDRYAGFARAQVTIDARNPLGFDSREQRESNTYRDGGSPIGPYPAPGEGGPR